MINLSNHIQFSSTAQSCPTLCNPMDWNMPGFSVHQLPEHTQTHVQRVSDTLQPSHPLSSPSPPAFNLSQHQDLFQRVSSSNHVAKVLEFQFQHQSFQWIVSAGGQCEELRPWQRSWGRRLGIHKGVIKPQETPCSRASNPKTRVCFMLSPTPLTLRGALPHNRFSWRRSKREAPRQ